MNDDLEINEDQIKRKRLKIIINPLLKGFTDGIQRDWGVWRFCFDYELVLIIDDETRKTSKNKTGYLCTKKNYKMRTHRNISQSHHHTYKQHH